jgi:hypothetical protein
MPPINDESDGLTSNNGDIEEHLALLECVSAIDKQIVAAGISDPVEREQIAYLLFLMSFPCSSGPH